MKKNKIVVANISEKLICGTTMFALFTTSLVGCSSNKTFDYNVDNNGIILVSGVVDFNYLKECLFVVIENPDYDITEFYIARNNKNAYSTRYDYRNILTGEIVFTRDKDACESISESSERKLVEEFVLEDYLFSLGNVKAQYSKEDVEEILEQLKEFYLMQNNKQKVKE